MQALLTHID